MNNTFEFIEVEDWCRLALSKYDLLENKKTYLPLFEQELLTVDECNYQNLKANEASEKFFSMPSSNSGLTLDDLTSGLFIGGSFMAHLGPTLIRLKFVDIG